MLGSYNLLPKKTGTRIPSDWVLPKDWQDWAVSQQMDQTYVHRQADRFKDFWLGVPGQKGVKLDWFATWRNWVRKALEDYQSKQAFSQKSHQEPEPLYKRLARQNEIERNLTPEDKKRMAENEKRRAELFDPMHGLPARVKEGAA